MNRQDVCRLFDLLEQLYQGKRKPRDNVTVAIWAEVLKPWSYEQVRTAVVQRARENRFFPDPSEIVAYLPAMQEDRPMDERLAAALDRRRQEVDQWWAQRKAALDAAGLPTSSEFVQKGGTVAEYWRLLKAAGIEGGADDGMEQ